MMLLVGQHMNYLIMITTESRFPLFSRPKWEYTSEQERH